MDRDDDTTQTAAAGRVEDERVEEAADTQPISGLATFSDGEALQLYEG